MTAEDKKYTLYSLLKNSIEKHPHRAALSLNHHTRLTYSQLGEMTEIIGSFLNDRKIAIGDKIAILGENSPNWAVTFFGVTTHGRVAVPILPDFSSQEINNILTHSEAKILFISERLFKKHLNKLDFKGEKIFIDNFTIDHSLTHIMDPDFVATLPKHINNEPSPNDLASIIYTSGTTGRSKGVMLTHDNLTFTAENVLLIQDITKEDSFLSLLPLSHVYENVLGLILPIRQGAHVHYMNKPPTPTLLLKTLQEVKPTIMLSVPLIIEKIYQSRVKSKLGKKFSFAYLVYHTPFRKLLHRKAGKMLLEAFGGRLRFFGIGGAPLDSATETFLREAKFPYSCGYGMTETASLIFGAKVSDTTHSSVGPALNGVEYKLINKNSKTGEGEVVVRGRNVMKGYFKEPELTAEVIDQQGWLHTGDLAKFVDGNLHLKGRSKNMILGPSGENIYPEEIESVLNNMEGVIESIVYEMKGKIVAKVYLNQEELSKKYDYFKSSAAEKHEEMHKLIHQHMVSMRNSLNSKLNNFSHVAELQIIKSPFEKTPTHKIKRYLYK
ncbi:MAG: AMP-binding protein [Bacteroidales bacterium]